MLPTSIFVPLYTAAVKYPQLTFNTVSTYLSKNILNSDHVTNPISLNIANCSGPNPGSDTNYITYIATLHNYTNINTLGYVHIHVSPSNRTNLGPTSDVVAETTQYSTWNLSSSDAQGQDIHFNGIFIDEAPYDVANYTYMSTITIPACSHSFSPVIFNPDTVDTDRMYFNLANYIVMFENTYSYFSTGGGNTSLGTIEYVYRSRSIIDIYDFDGGASVQSGIFSELVRMGFGKLYFNDLPNSSLAQMGAYDHFEPLFGDFVDSVVAASSSGGYLCR